MAKSGEARKRRLARQAIKLRQTAQRDLTIMIALACVCFGAIAAYTFALKAGIIEDEPLAQGIVLVVAIVIGVFSLRHSKNRRKFLDFLDECGLTKEDVREQMRLDHIG